MILFALLQLSVCLGILNSSLANQMELNYHPIVGASAGELKIEVRNKHNYYGQIFVGSKYEEVRIIFDTMSTWTSILQTKTSGYTILSNYDQEESRTASPLYSE